MKKAAECPSHSAAFRCIVRIEISDQLLDCCAHILHIGGWLEAGNDISLAVNEEFGEIPLDLGVILVIRIDFLKHSAHKKSLWSLAESLESLLALEIFVQVKRDLLFFK